MNADFVWTVIQKKCSPTFFYIKVIIIEPFFDCYDTMVQLAGGTSKFISLVQTKTENNCAGEWKLDDKNLAELFNTKTKAIILNTPNNPLGKVFTREELQVILKILSPWVILTVDCLYKLVTNWNMYCTTKVHFARISLDYCRFMQKVQCACDFRRSL